MSGRCDRVHQLGETKEIGLLAQVSEAVCLLAVETVLEVPIEGLGVSPPRVERPKSGSPGEIARRFSARLRRLASSSAELSSRTVISRVAYSLGISYWL